jgi:hypothetical protein
MKPEIGREYNIQSYHRPNDDTSYIFRGIVLNHRYEKSWRVRVTAYSIGRGQKPGDEISVTEVRFKSLVATNNLEAKNMLSKEW